MTKGCLGLFKGMLGCHKLQYRKIPSGLVSLHSQAMAKFAGVLTHT